AIQPEVERSGERAPHRGARDVGRPIARAEEAVDDVEIETLERGRNLVVALAYGKWRVERGGHRGFARRRLFLKRATPSVTSRLASSASTQLATRTHLP